MRARALRGPGGVQGSETQTCLRPAHLPGRWGRALGRGGPPSLVFRGRPGPGSRARTSPPAREPPPRRASRGSRALPRGPPRVRPPGARRPRGLQWPGASGPVAGVGRAQSRRSENRWRARGREGGGPRAGAQRDRSFAAVTRRGRARRPRPVPRP